MKKVLIYQNRKQDPKVWDVSNPELELASFLALFRYLKDEWQVYYEFEKGQKVLYNNACLGDRIAARRLLESRKKYEYEEWTIADVEE